MLDHSHIWCIRKVTWKGYMPNHVILGMGELTDMHWNYVEWYIRTGRSVARMSFQNDYFTVHCLLLLHNKGEKKWFYQYICMCCVKTTISQLTISKPRPRISWSWWQIWEDCVLGQFLCRYMLIIHDDFSTLDPTVLQRIHSFTPNTQTPHTPTPKLRTFRHLFYHNIIIIRDRICTEL